MRLVGIEIGNFRSIGSEPVILNPWRKCNILIGQNNVGKSNAIRAVCEVSEMILRKRKFSSVNTHRRNSAQPFEVKLLFEETDPKLDGKWSKFTQEKSF
jgi:AAA15 family ATPase/GTPase